MVIISLNVICLYTLLPNLCQDGKTKKQLLFRHSSIGVRQALWLTITQWLWRICTTWQVIFPLLWGRSEF